MGAARTWMPAPASASSGAAAAPPAQSPAPLASEGRGSVAPGAGATGLNAVLAPQDAAVVRKKSTLQLAAQAWQRRAEQPFLYQALALYTAQAQATPDDPEVGLALARAALLAGTEQLVRERDTAAADTLFVQGLRAAQAALRHEVPAAQRPLALFLLAAHLFHHAWHGDLGDATILHAQVVAALQQSLAADATTFAGMAHSLLAAHLCRMPPQLGGDLTAAAAHFSQARAIAPQFAWHTVLQAQELLARAQNSGPQYAAELAAVAAQPAALPDWGPEQALAKLQARRLLTAHHAGLW